MTVPESKNRSANAPGAYQIFITLESDVLIKIGALGNIAFLAGCYVYTGSALRGLLARVARHLKSEKSLHWHIDYLLACESSRIVQLNLFPSKKRLECQLNQTMRKKLGAKSFAPGFGASDCTNGCISHLSYLGNIWPWQQGHK
jgi:sugar fermentation stimulation protein A